MDELIAGVTPPTGYCCLVAIRGSTLKQTFFTSREDMVDAGKKVSGAGINAYFAVASFKTNTSRTQDNVQALKAFWLDVDCKGRNELEYANKQEGREAINAFMHTHNMPTPTIVNSGNGWHVYWALEHAITPEVWRPIAEQLKMFCLSGALRIDPACTADSARILRIPDTLNYRNDPPDVVELDSPVYITPLEQFTEALGQACKDMRTPVLVPPKKKGAKPKNTGWIAISEATSALTDNTFPPSSFSKIMRRSRDGTGCAQLNRAYTERATLDQTSWWHMLSIAQQCTDRDDVIYKMSEGYSGYTPQATDKKATETDQKPHACERFNETHPGVCTLCPHWGKITNPLALGLDVVATTAPLTLPAVQEIRPITVTTYNESSSAEDMMGALVNYTDSRVLTVIPVAPEGFGIDPTSGAVMKGTQQIYAYPMYIGERVYDAEDGMSVRVRLGTALDGNRDLVIPVVVLRSREKLKEMLTKHGVLNSDKDLVDLGEYLRKALEDAQKMVTEHKARVQMGWQRDGTFVVGDREYSREGGIAYCATTRATLGHQSKFSASGSLSAWKKMVSVYNKPGFEPFQFGLLLGCASPLLHTVGQTGMLISYFSDESGLGKTTFQRVVNSIWGHPTTLMAQPKDTANSIIHQMCIYNSLPLCIDEYTNKSPQECSDIVYASHTGRDKQRMTAEANIMRTNTATCANITFVSANASILDRVSSYKASVEAEHMRVLEFDMRGTPRLQKQHADEIFSALNNNYGTAGHAIAMILMQKGDSLKDAVLNAQKRVDIKFRFTSKERIWSVAISCALAMGELLRVANLLDIDMTRLEAYMLDAIDKQRGIVVTNVTTVGSILGEFLSANNGSILVVNGIPDANGLYPVPRNSNIHSIVGRYEPDTKKLWIITSQLRAYCNAQQASFQSVIAETGGVSMQKRLGSGTSTAAPNTTCLYYDLSTPTAAQKAWAV